MGKHIAYRYVDGSSHGREVAESATVKAAFAAAKKDAQSVLDDNNGKAAEDAKLPAYRRRCEPCHMIADDKARVIEIRSDEDGLLMYYYDVV